jgi:hypothetical protein
MSLDVCLDLLNIAILVVNEKTFVVEQYLGGDYKLICTVCGLEAPACNYSMILTKSGQFQTLR